LLAYAVALAAFLLIPPTLKPSVGPPQAFTAQEAMDLLTPLVILPLAWWILDATGGLHGRALVAFIVIAALWGQAQGIHLAANAIGDAFNAGPDRDAFYATTAGDLDHWLDEVLGHWAWHVAWVALSVLMLVLAGHGGPVQADGRGRALSTLAGAIAGVVFFFVTTEGDTWQLGIPACVVLLAWAGRDRLRGSSHPIVVFLIASSVATLLGYLIWAIRFGWPLVEPCTLLHC
jgi:hypothetical protein